jgi:hypothetical protein
LWRRCHTIVNVRRVMGRIGPWAVACLILTGCEKDELSPVSDFMGTDCEDVTNCGEGSYKLDSGVVQGDVDGGVIDAGADRDGGGTLDGGVGRDGGPRDGGPRDGGVVPSTFINVVGTYQAEYLFDLSDYAFGLGGIASDLDRINELLQGRSHLGQPWEFIVDPILRQIVDDYIPDWFVQFFNTINNIANLFTDIEADAILNVQQDLPLNPTDTTTAIHGNETWSAFYLRWIDQCPQGRQTTSPIPYPQCAQVPIPILNRPTPIPVGGTGGVEVAVYIPPFDGTLNAGVPEADLVFEDREVEIEMRKFVLLVLDTVTNIVTGGAQPTFRGALLNAVQCQQLANQIAQSNAAAAAALNALCVGLINGAVDAIADIATDVDALEFDQYGHAVDTNPQDGQNRAEILQVQSAPDTIDGRFRLVGSSDLGGVWEASK